MKWNIIIPRTVLKKELGHSKISELTDADKKALIAATNTAKQTQIGKCGLSRGVVVKVELTTAAGARRMALLSLGEDNTLFLLFLRDKNDDIGKNISAGNAKFITALDKIHKTTQKELTANDAALVIIEDDEIVEMHDPVPVAPAPAQAKPEPATKSKTSTKKAVAAGKR